MTSASARQRPPATRIAVTSGKGGVGKTSLTINLGVALARLGHRVGILDADFALGNVDVLLGLTPEHHLGAVLAGTMDVHDVTLDGPSGLRVIPAGSGVRGLTSLDETQWTRLVHAVHKASDDLDFLLFDTASGIGDTVLDVVGLADYALVVTSYDPAAVVDAYAVIKLLTAAAPAKPIGVVVNSAADADEGHVVFRQIALAAERFLGRSLRYDGHIVDDATVKRQGYQQEPHVGVESAGPASRCVRRLASRLAAARPSGPGPWAGRRADIEAVVAKPATQTRTNLAGDVRPHEQKTELPDATPVGPIRADLTESVRASVASEPARTERGSWGPASEREGGLAGAPPPELKTELCA